MFFFFFFNDPATTEIYTLSLHDALPISTADLRGLGPNRTLVLIDGRRLGQGSPYTAIASPAQWLYTENPDRAGDRKSTRLNSSHSQISYAVFCLKKKKQDYSHNCTTLTN